jgi:hypothetical protein
LALCFQGLHDTLPTGRLFNRPTGTGNQLAERYVAFLIVGHTAIGFVLGVCGGEIARRMAAKMPPVAAWSSDRA